MTITQARELLEKHDIPYDKCEYACEKDYWLHFYEDVALAKTQGKVAALVICSNNGRKNIELQFNKGPDGFVFRELYFGGYDYEMFDYKEEMLADDLTEQILAAMSGEVCIIEAYDRRAKTVRWDAYFDRSGAGFCEAEYQKTLRRTEKNSGSLHRLFRWEMQYEIYDWNTYRYIEPR